MNERSGCVVAESVEIAATLVSRLVGLMGRAHPADGLVITGCRQIHTFFVRFAIDVVAVDDEWRVVGVEPDVRPFTVSKYWKEAAAIVELPAGMAERCDLRVGDFLREATKSGLRGTAAP